MTSPGKRRWSRIVTLLATLAAALLLPATPADAATNLYQANIHSNLCLSPAGGSTGVNAAIVQYYCDGNAARIWSLPTAPGGTAPGGDFYIRNSHSGLCLSPAGGSTAANVTLVQYYCDSNPARRWTLIYVTHETYHIYNEYSHLCVSPAGGSVGINVIAVQYYCDSDPSREWTTWYPA